jgi:hypothetical protein
VVDLLLKHTALRSNPRTARIAEVLDPKALKKGKNKTEHIKVSLTQIKHI